MNMLSSSLYSQMAGDSAAAMSWSNFMETKCEMHIILVDKELVESEVVGHDCCGSG